MVSKNVSGEKRILVLGGPGVDTRDFIRSVLRCDRVFYYGADTQNMKFVEVDGQRWLLHFNDLHSSFSHKTAPTYWTANADGIILLYDTRSEISFDYVTKETYRHAWKCRASLSQSQDEDARPTAKERFGCILVGTTAGKESEISVTQAQSWAESQSQMWFELDSSTQELGERVIKELVRNITYAEKRNAEDLQEHIQLKKVQ